MTRTTRNTRNETRYTFYLEQLRAAETPFVTFTGIAMAIGECEEYTKTEKGWALEALAQAWNDFTTGNE